MCRIGEVRNPSDSQYNTTNSAESYLSVIQSNTNVRNKSVESINVKNNELESHRNEVGRENTKFFMCVRLECVKKLLGLQVYNIFILRPPLSNEWVEWVHSTLFVWVEWAHSTLSFDRWVEWVLSDEPVEWVSHSTHWMSNESHSTSSQSNEPLIRQMSVSWDQQACSLNKSCNPCI